MTLQLFFYTQAHQKFPGPADADGNGLPPTLTSNDIVGQKGSIPKTPHRAEFVPPVSSFKCAPIELHDRRF